MKRVLILFAALTLTFGLAACKGEPAPQSDGGRPQSQTQAQPEAEASPIRFLGKRDDVAAGAQGVYYLGANAPNVVYYFDEASGRSVPLCARPECPHELGGVPTYVLTRALWEKHKANKNVGIRPAFEDVIKANEVLRKPPKISV